MAASSTSRPRRRSCGPCLHFCQTCDAASRCGFCFPALPTRHGGCRSLHPMDRSDPRAEDLGVLGRGYGGFKV